MDDLPKRISGSRSKHLRNYETKSFSDLLGPLQRFLRGNVGRPWDAVYSEMSERLDNRKTTGRHIFEHVEWEVAANCYEENGAVYEYNRAGRARLVEGLYVHPRTGLLCWAPLNRHSPRKEKREVVRIEIGRRDHYIKQNGVWYIAEMKREGQGQSWEPQLPIFVDQNSAQWRILQKKQCNTKELKAAGLKNATA